MGHRHSTSICSTKVHHVHAGWIGFVARRHRAVGYFAPASCGWRWLQFRHADTGGDAAASANPKCDLCAAAGRLRGQGPAAAVSYVDAQRTDAGAGGGRDFSRRPETRHLRHVACAAAAGTHLKPRMGARDSLHRLGYAALRGADCPGAAKPASPVGIRQYQPRRAGAGGAVCTQRPERAGQLAADAQYGPGLGRLVLHGGRIVRTAGVIRAVGVRRAGPPSATTGVFLLRFRYGIDRPAWHQRLPRRIPDVAGGV